MENVFWPVPDRVAGRCGPNEQDWDLERVRAVRPIAFTTVGGYDFAFEVLSAAEQRR